VDGIAGWKGDAGVQESDVVLRQGGEIMSVRTTAANWGFDIPKEASGTRTVLRFPDGTKSLRPQPEREPLDPVRDINQVQVVLADGITPKQLLAHPYIKLTKDAKAHLERLESERRKSSHGGWS
jgi:hypothetical protein